MPSVFLRPNILHIVLVLSLSFCEGLAAAGGTTSRRLEPLPLDVAAVVDLIGHNNPLALSPDGQWIAQDHAVSGATMEQGSSHYSSTGLPLTDETGRRHITLVNVKSGKVHALGAAESSAWAPVWSPNGALLAYYSDEGGEAGVWIWEAATARARRIPGVIPRSYFGFQDIHWLADGQRIVCRVLGAGESVAAANARDRGSERSPHRVLQIDAGRPSVSVFSAPRAADVKRDENSGPDLIDTGLEWTKADLALIDVRSVRITRLEIHAAVQSYAISPDGKHIAYTVLRNWGPTTGENFFDFAVYEVASGATRWVRRNIGGWIGIEWNWSPDSRRLAYIGGEAPAAAELWVISLESNAVRKLGDGPSAGFTAGSGWSGTAPLWDTRGEKIYALRNGGLWQVDVASGKARAVGGGQDRQLTSLITRRHLPTVWSTDGGATIWASFSDRKGGSGIERIDVGSGKGTVVLPQAKQYLGLFDASDVTRDIVFIASDQEHLADVWLYRTRTGRAQQATHLNPLIDQYEFGKTRLIEWRDLDGRPLRGALLLPSGYRAGRRVPLVVWVYGGALGSQHANQFGLVGAWANMQVLATRGYAVLFPDAPLRVGRPMDDLASTVLPGVNAAIDYGYADPDRLAVMGHSYGSYCTLALLTRTNRFKAAIISAVADTDLFSGYVQMSPDGAGVNTGYYERGQGNMGGTPWEYPERYYSNSPILLFDRIETPLLMAQGTQDFLPLRNAEGIFVALQRLGKPVEYRVYEGEEHVVMRKANVIDWWQRRLAFLAEHLDLTLDDKGAIAF